MTSIQIARQTIETYLDCNIPAFIWGAPGLGKSDLVRQIANDRNLPLIDVRAVLLDPVDLRGIPSIENNVTRWNPPAFLPIAARDGESGILFLDELNAAPQSVQAALFQLVLDRKLGEYALPDGWRVIAAGNRQSDRASAQRMPSALANRFAHVDVNADVAAWSNWASASGIDPLLIAFINFRAELLHKMDGVELRAFPTPRAWSQVSKILHASAAALPDLVSGLVGESAMVEFIGFYKVAKQLPALADIFANPSSAILPIEASARYAVACLLGRKIEQSNIASAITYLDRIGPEFCTMALRDAVARNPAMKETTAFVQWAIKQQSITL